MSSVCLFDHPTFREHDTGPGHPERSERLDAIVRGIRERKGLAERLEWREPSPVAERHLLRVHSERHVRRILNLRGKQEMIDGDTRVSPASVDAALAASGSVIEAVDLVLADPESSVFCLTRPPGHHAERDVAMGFCLFNHAAVAAAYAVAEKAVKRVLIFDPDVHHGNGTQEIFYESGDVCYVSIHQWPLFPGTGLTTETGSGPGAGLTVNLPLPAGMGDADYRFAVEQVLFPMIRGFDPGLVIFSAGFDAHELDPLGSMRVTAGGFVEFYAAIMAELSARKIPSFYCLEGGYSLDALRETVPALLEMLLDRPAVLEAGGQEPDPAVRRVVSELREKVPLL